MSALQECIYLSWHESVKIQQYVGIKFGKDVANKIKYSKMETAVTQSEGAAFGLKKAMES
jgi:hypothetical protein